MNLTTAFCEEIQSEMGILNKTEVGTDEYKHLVDGITKLADRAIEMEKFEAELEEKAKNREFEENIRLRQLEEDHKNRFIGHCISVAGIVVPVVVTIWGTLKSFEFEKDGTVTTIMGRGFVNKLLPKK